MIKTKRYSLAQIFEPIALCGKTIFAKTEICRVGFLLIFFGASLLLNFELIDLLFLSHIARRY